MIMLHVISALLIIALRLVDRADDDHIIRTGYEVFQIRFTEEHLEISQIFPLWMEGFKVMK